MVTPVKDGSSPTHIPSYSQRFMQSFSLSNFYDCMESLSPDESSRMGIALSYIKPVFKKLIRALVFLHDLVFSHIILDQPSKRWSDLATGILETSTVERLNDREFVADDVIEFGELNPDFFKELMDKFFIELEKVGKGVKQLQELEIREFVQTYLVFDSHNFRLFLDIIQTYRDDCS